MLTTAACYKYVARAYVSLCCICWSDLALSVVLTQKNKQLS